MNIIKGDSLKTAQAQPGRTVTESSDGTLEGSIVWKIDSSLVPPEQSDTSTLLPAVAMGDKQPGGLHLDDDRLECYNRTLSYGANGILTCTAAYFGLVTPKTEYQISFTGGTQVDRIETHKNFETFAGTPSAPKNGAKFDDVTQEFLGFTDFVAAVPGRNNKGTNANFLGIDNHLTATTTITLSWWQDTTPRPSVLATVHPHLPFVEEFRRPKGVKNFLLINETYKQVGNFYQVTQNYLGSSVEGGKGWSKTIYDSK